MKHIPMALLMSLSFISLMGCHSTKERVWEKVYESSIGDHQGYETDIISLHFLDRNRGWAATANSLYETSDGGKSWNKRNMNRDGLFTFYSIDGRNPTHLWIPACYQNHGMICISHDGGESWQRSEIPQVEGILSVHFCSNDIGWAVGSIIIRENESVSKIFHTNDGGKTWNEQQSEKKIVFDLMSIISYGCEEIFTVGSDGLILHSKDGGAKWNRYEAVNFPPLYRIRSFGHSLWIVGVSGTLLQSRDRGLTWQRIPLETNESLFDILLLGKQGWIVGTGGILISTRDGGIHWKIEKPITSKTLCSLAYYDKSVWAGGEKQTVFRLQNE